MNNDMTKIEKALEIQREELDKLTLFIKIDAIPMYTGAIMQKISRGAATADDLIEAMRNFSIICSALKGFQEISDNLGEAFKNHDSED